MSNPEPQPINEEAADLDPVALTDEEFGAALEAEAEAEGVAYQGTDFDVEGLVRRLDRHDIIIPNFGHGEDSLELAAFQRSFVWSKPQMDRFIESLLLGYPIPGIMLVQQTDKRYLVLDGQQRLSTLQAFYSGVHRGRVFALENVAAEYKGLTYKTLMPEQRRTLDNTFIQATIVRTDGTSESQEAIYQVFERLNSGGTQLTPHEIRIALYPGPFVDLLGKLNALPEWREIYGAQSPRLRDHEVILRILALFVRSEEYYRPLKKFLNDFLGTHRDLRKLPAEELEDYFKRAVTAVANAGGRTYLRRPGQRLNVAVMDAVVVGAMRRVQSHGELPVEVATAALEELFSSRALESSTTTQTDADENVRTRLKVATAAFAR